MPPKQSETGALQAICDQGLALHQGGRLDEAKLRYEQVLAVDPDHFDALHLLGVFCLQTGQLETAAALIGRAVARRPDPAALGNLATALNSLGRSEEALAVSNQAIGLDPGAAEAHGNRGQALHALGRVEEALASYDRVIALKPGARAHHNRATMLRALGRLEDALASYDRVIALQPGDAAAHRNRGVVLGELGRPEAALESYDRAIALRPDYAEAHVSRGITLRRAGRPEDALASYDRAIALRPTDAQAHGHRGDALSDLKRPDEALLSYDRAIALKPDYAEAFAGMAVPLRELGRSNEALAACDRAVALKLGHAEAHNTRGSVLAQMRRLDEALASFDRAIALKPDFAEAHDNRGVALFELRRLDEALASYDRATALKPDNAEAQHHQAMCRLALGDFAAGWAQYEWRWRTAHFRPAVRDLKAPLWLGCERLAGRTILLHAEQGLGDTLQFCRHAREVAALGAEVILEVPPALTRLLARLEGAGRILPLGEPPPPHDFQTPLLSLPLALGASPPAWPGPYLSADPEIAAAWAARLAESGARRIGLCWAGGPRPGEQGGNAIDARRSLPLDAFAPLAELEGVQVYSLQKGPPAAQLAEAQARGWSGPRILDLTAELHDFADTAALVANLDLVITCDTSIAHLAGGMGKPVWILNRFDACWRWLDGCDDSPWYPSARLFRQAAPGDWAGVVERVKGALSRWTPSPGSRR